MVRVAQTVKQLRELLEFLPDNAPVVITHDDETGPAIGVEFWEEEEVNLVTFTMANVPTN